MHRMEISKGIQLFIAIASVMFANQTTIKAQTTLPNYPNQISVNSGVSFTSILLKTLLNGDSVKYDYKSSASLAINYDRFVNNWLSLGAGYSSQAMSIKFDEYIDNNNVLQTGDFSADFKRNHAHLKVLATKVGKKGDLYAGLRLGYLWYKSDLSFEKRELKVLNKIDELLQVGRPTLGIPLGGRYFVSNKLGVNAELNLGAPHILSVGLTFRFGDTKKN